MRVGFRELTIWSFLMATAHGAGLMVLPLLVGTTGAGAAGTSRACDAPDDRPRWCPALPARWPSASGRRRCTRAGYLLVTGLIALLVYRKLGLRMLRTMWINLDLIWGGALVVTGTVALLT